MPKRGRDFPDQLSFGVTKDLRLNLIALSYQMGGGGQYALSARNLLEKAMRERLAGMEEKERQEFEQILANVRIMDAKGDVTHE